MSGAREVGAERPVTDALVDQLRILSNEQRFLADDFESMQSEPGQRSARLCAARADTLANAADQMESLSAEVRRLREENTDIKQTHDELAREYDKLHASYNALFNETHRGAA